MRARTASADENLFRQSEHLKHECGPVAQNLFRQSENRKSERGPVTTKRYLVTHDCVCLLLLVEIKHTKNLPRPRLRLPADGHDGA